MKIVKEDFKRFYPEIKAGRMKAKAAASALRITASYFCTFCKKYEKQGDRVFTHGLRGKVSNRAIPQSVKERVYNLYIKECGNNNFLNFAYFKDELAEQYDIKVSYCTVYNILHKTYGLDSPECHKPRKERAHRTRFCKEHFGELLQNRRNALSMV